MMIPGTMRFSKHRGLASKSVSKPSPWRERGRKLGERMAISHDCKRTNTNCPSPPAPLSEERGVCKQLLGQLPSEPTRISPHPRPLSPGRGEFLHNSSRHRQEGFTLVEVLLALALSVVLMGAVYVGLSLYRQLSTTGREQVERSQIIRALQRKMTVDVRSVVFTPPSETGEESAGTTAEEAGSESTEETTNEIEIIDPTDAITVAAKGIIGDSQSLVLHISRPPRDFNYSSLQDAQRTSTGQSSDLLTVTYLLSSPDAGGLQAAVANATGKSGLARLSGDRLTMDIADAAGNVDQLASTAVILAEEVRFVQFHYWDGLQWYETWDSNQTGTLPRAIEVTLGLRNPASSAASSESGASGNTTGTGGGTPGNNDDTQTLRYYTFVIAVPAADHAPPEALELGF